MKGPAQGGGTPGKGAIGILMLETRFPRVPGDVGNPLSWPFPVIRREVPKATTDLVVRQGARGLLPAFIEAGHALVDEGAIGITTTCGFLSLMQADLSAALPVPVLTSSLLQVGMINRLLPGGKRAGILTISASTLTEEHLRAADVPKGTPIGSTEEGTEFTKAILSNAPSLDVDAARADLVAAALHLKATHCDVGAIVLECTNMGPYAADIHRATGLPVYSIIDAVMWFRAGLTPQTFPSAMSAPSEPPAPHIAAVGDHP